MNRNVSIVVVILVLVVIAGYLVWLRSKVTSPVTPGVEQVEVTATPQATLVASPSATPAQEATGAGKQRTTAPSAR